MVQLNKTVKYLAINYYNEKDQVTQEEVSNIFGINIRTFQRWLYIYNKNIPIERKKRISGSYKIKKKHVKYSLQMIKRNPHISINTLHELIKKKFSDYSITLQHLGKVIRDNNITRKRTAKRHYPKTRYGKTVNLKKELKQFYSVVDKFTLDKIICLDEISIHAMMKPSYSRCELGKRCIMKTTNNTVFIKYTIIAAISSKGVIGWKMYEKGDMTGERMVKFINEFIKNKFKNNLIIMDNAGSHRNIIVKEAVCTSNNILHYSVPYKPKTNAIETWFSQFKHYFIHQQKEKLSYNDLKKVVKKAIKKVKKESYFNIMKYAYGNKKKRNLTGNVSSIRRPPKIYRN